MSSPSGLQVWIEQADCVSAGRCVAAAPELFHFDDDELAVVDEQAPRPDDETIIRIARACPNGAIRVARDGVDIEL